MSSQEVYNLLVRATSIVATVALMFAFWALWEVIHVYGKIQNLPEDPYNLKPSVRMIRRVLIFLEFLILAIIVKLILF